MEAFQMIFRIVEIVFYGAVIAYIVRGWNK